MERVGLQLVADGADKYLSDLQKGAKAEEAIAAGAKAAAPAVDALGDKAKGAGKEVDGLGEGAEKGGKGLSFLQQMAVGATRKLGELAVEGAAAAGKAVLDFAVDGVKAAGNFESGMNRFASVTGDALGQSGKSVEDFKQLFIGLGRDLPVSTSEVQEAAINMAKGGIEPATIAAGGLKTVLDLAAAGEVGIAEAAEISAKQLGVWVDKAASAAEKARFLKENADLLAAAANASTVNVDSLALGLANVGGMAKTSGLTFHETVQTMALLAPGFSSAADAGTSLKTMLGRLQPTTDAATEAMARLGLLTEQGRSKFYDATGSFIGMDKAAGLLHESLEGLSQAERTTALQAIFGQDALRAAAILAEQGSKGYEDMGQSMGAAGTAAQQAAKKQQGFNVAVDNLQGSLEAFQIMVMGKALPALTNLVGGVAGGINAITNFADATMKGDTFLAKLAGTVETLFVPAISAAGAALTTYAVVQAVRATPAILASLPAIAAQTAAFVANAGAVALAIAPYALIAAAIGGVVLAYQNLNTKITEGTTALLESKKWWTDSTAALDTYSQSADYVQQIAGKQADALKLLRAQQEAEIESLARRQLINPNADYSAEYAAIKDRSKAIQEATGLLNDQLTTYDEQHLRSYDAIEDVRALRGAHGELREALGLTDEAMGKLVQDLKDIRDAGAKALGELINTHAGFVEDIEDRQAKHEDTMAALMKEKADAQTKDQQEAIDKRIEAEKKGYDEQLVTAAKAYAEQAALQKQALGEQLLAYIENQRQMGRITDEQAGQLRETTIKHFGIMRDSAAVLFGDMTKTIDQFAAGAITDAGDVAKRWGDTEDAAVKLKEKADKLKDRYTMEIIADFEQGKITIEEAKRKLNEVPQRVESEIIITTVHREKYESGGYSEDTPSGGGGRRAAGGPVDPMQAYTVGEHGPELFVPDVPGTIIPAQATRAAILSLAGGGGNSTSYGPTNNFYVDARGSNLTMSQIQGAIEAALDAKGGAAYNRMITGA